jgi:hypothetical protein
MIPVRLGPTVFSKNRDRLLGAEVARKFLSELLTHRQQLRRFQASSKQSGLHTPSQ